ncbi:hypothetical protein Fmac_011743 [Flemingia macrophylla]|uniref:Uncharacterized protein n=1 Tax=Flemingia macrophylla TaxID=520843 RepID=A0ABD1MNC4_9FABA
MQSIEEEIERIGQKWKKRELRSGGGEPKCRALALSSHSKSEDGMQASSTSKEEHYCQPTEVNPLFIVAQARKLRLDGTYWQHSYVIMQSDSDDSDYDPNLSPSHEPIFKD